MPPSTPRPPATGGQRRRRRGNTPLLKTALSLHADVLAGVDAAVGAGLAPNRSAFIEAAVQDRLHRMRRADLERAYAAAATDPAFLADMDAADAALDRTTPEGLGSGADAADAAQNR